MEEKNENPVVEEVKATEEVKTDVKAEAKDEVLKEGGDMKVKPKKPKQKSNAESHRKQSHFTSIIVTPL